MNTPIKREREREREREFDNERRANKKIERYFEKEIELRGKGDV